MNLKIYKLIGSIAKLFPIPTLTDVVIAPDAVAAPEPKPRIRVAAAVAPVEPKTKASPAKPAAKATEGRKPKQPQFRNGRLRFESADDFEAWKEQIVERKD